MLCVILIWSWITGLVESGLDASSPLGLRTLLGLITMRSPHPPSCVWQRGSEFTPFPSENSGKARCSARWSLASPYTTHFLSNSLTENNPLDLKSLVRLAQGCGYNPFVD
jgi:hypothetical protein